MLSTSFHSFIHVCTSFLLHGPTRQSSLLSRTNEQLNVRRLIRVPHRLACIFTSLGGSSSYLSLPLAGRWGKGSFPSLVPPLLVLGQGRSVLTHKPRDGSPQAQSQAGHDEQVHANVALVVLGCVEQHGQEREQALVQEGDDDLG